MVYKAVRVPPKHDRKPVFRKRLLKRSRHSRQTRCRWPCHPAQDRFCASRRLAVATAAALLIAVSLSGARAGADPAQAADGGCPAGRARLLGPQAAAGAAGPVAHHRDPLFDRDRLPAVQFYRPGRQSGRLQCRSGALAVRGDQGHLHRPDAALRDAVGCDHQQPGRRHHRLDRGDAADARPGRFHRSRITGRRRGSCRAGMP